MRIKYLILFLLLFAVPSFAADFYISTDGSGTTCSKAVPCSTSSIPWTTVDNETSTVYLMGGTYNTQLRITHSTQANTLTVKPCSASPDPTSCDSKVIFAGITNTASIVLSGHNIVIDGRTTGASTTPCDAGDVTSCNIKVDATGVSYTSSGYMIYLYAGGIGNTLKWMELTGKDTPATSEGAYFICARDAGAGTVFSNNYIHDNPWAQSDILTYASSSSNAYGVVSIRDNIFRKGSVNYISSAGSWGLDIYNNIFDVSEARAPYDVLHSYSTTGIAYLRIYNNYFDSKDQMIFLEAATSTQCSSGPCKTEHIQIYNNIFTCTAPAGIATGKPIMLENVHYSGGQVNGLVDDVVIANNSFINTHYAVRMMGSAEAGTTNTYTNFKFINNIYSETSAFAYYDNSWVISVEGNTTWANEADAVFNNNLLYDNDGLKSYWLTSGASKQYTTFCDGTGEGCTWATDHNTYLANKVGDPKFTSTTDFTLQSDSPAIDSGMSLTSYFTTDKTGDQTRPIGSVWDIGAYEYVSGEETQYTVTPTLTGSHCTMSPAIAVSVESGNTTAFTYTCNNGWQAAWSGTCGGTGTSTYTTSAITGNCGVTLTTSEIQLNTFCR